MRPIYVDGTNLLRRKQGKLGYAQIPPAQTPEQHCVLVVQSEPAGRQLAAEALVGATSDTTTGTDTAAATPAFRRKSRREMRDRASGSK